MSTKNKIGNNGSRLAQYMEFNGLLFNGISAEQGYEIAKKEDIMLNNLHLEYDDFWEDWCDMVGQLGFKVAY